MWQFMNVIEGISEACQVFNIPVTGGNVSFYNDTEGVSIYPTPVLGIVGRLDDVNQTTVPFFRQEGDTICLLGENTSELGASEYLKSVHKQEQGIPPQIDLVFEKKVQDLCIAAIKQGLLVSAHDVSEGGLAICLAESAFLCDLKIGFDINCQDDMRPDALLFGESQSRICVSTHKKNLDILHNLAKEYSVPLTVLGKTGGNNMVIKHKGKEILNIPVLQGFNIWKQAIPEAFKIR
jgi:phosphoribosylformylglycinamidine synthase